MIRFCPGTQPRRRIPGPNAAIPVLGAPGERTPTRYTRPVGCAAALRGRARRLPATAPMKARRFMTGSRAIVWGGADDAVAWPPRGLADHAPGAGHHRGRDGDPERRGGFQVDRQLEAGGPLDG